MAAHPSLRRRRLPFTQAWESKTPITDSGEKGIPPLSKDCVAFPPGDPQLGEGCCAEQTKQYLAMGPPVGMPHFAAHKIEVLVWQLGHGRIAIKDELGSIKWVMPRSFRLRMVENKAKRPIMVWNKPDIGEVKFNVDRAINGCPSDTTIRGLLRNNKGKVLMRFSKSILITDSNLAEFLANREAFFLYIVEILKMGALVGKPQEKADRLAKDGVYREVALLEFGGESLSL
ncbi:Uncharacterized protein TCM_024694 [Theobroma cacao]|uniref:Uncharacterized protein n=1 Tax=Theobroma cacao TaxID=3641 RepID=A0A061EXZ0_THECC|nr:Uncharacterized protein TCM_024694 [Theobroma cacao]